MKYQSIPEQLTNQVSISCIENLVHESQKFLQEITSLGAVVLRIADNEGNKNHTLLYQDQAYVYVVPQAEEQNALIYGNWEEALHASKRLTAAGLNLQNQPHIVIEHHSLQ